MLYEDPDSGDVIFTINEEKVKNLSIPDLRKRLSNFKDSTELISFIYDTPELNLKCTYQEFFDNKNENLVTVVSVYTKDNKFIGKYKFDQ